MINNKVIEILRTLSAGEFREFEKFIASPFFAKGRNVMPLYKYLRKFYPEFSSPKMTAEDAFRKIYPGKTVSLQVIRNLLTTMQKMCGEYLFQINIKREKPDYYIHLGDELQYRRIFSLAEKNVSEGLNEVKQRGTDRNFFYYNYSLEYLNDQILQKNFRRDKRTKSIYTMSSYFLSYFISVANSVFDSIHTQSYNFNRAVNSNPLYIFIKDFVRLDDYISYLKNNHGGFSEIDEISLHLIKLCLNAEDEVSYNRLRALLRKNFNVLSKWEAFNIYSSLERIAAMLELKDKKYKGLLFDVYKEELKYNIYSFTEDGPMQPGFFTGIVTQAVAAGEHKWAHSFILKYKNKMLSENRESRYNHSLALISFAEKDYEKALKLISRIKKDAFAFKYYLKSLQLKIYYELNRYDEAFSLIDTFKHFLSSTKSLPQFRKDRYSAFIKYTVLLLKLRENMPEMNPPKLKTDIEKENLLVEKNWLMEKAEELGK